MTGYICQPSDKIILLIYYYTSKHGRHGYVSLVELTLGMVIYTVLILSIYFVSFSNEGLTRCPQPKGKDQSVQQHSNIA